MSARWGQKTTTRRDHHRHMPQKSQASLLFQYRCHTRGIVARGMIVMCRACRSSPASPRAGLRAGLLVYESDASVGCVWAACRSSTWTGPMSA
jgi:hypothetical protein